MNESNVVKNNSIPKETAAAQKLIPMGVSFKVSKKGTRFIPKPSVDDDDQVPVSAAVVDSSSNSRNPSADVAEGRRDVGEIQDAEVSFTLDLFEDGFSIGNPSESDVGHQTALQDASKILRPYDRTSDTMFSAIESGRIPGDVLDDIPCKYADGTVACEVRDYRKSVSDLGTNVSDGYPVTTKVCLKMSLENVVKDIPLISDDWTYGDLMEVESRILKVLQPQLCLDPTPKLDRLCQSPTSSKLKLTLSSLRRKRLRQMSEAAIESDNKIQGKRVCVENVPESSNYRLGDLGPIVQKPINENLTTQGVSPSNMLALRSKSYAPDSSVPASPSVSSQSKFQIGVGSQRILQDHGSGPVFNSSGVSSCGQDVMNSYVDNMNPNFSSIHGKRENQEAHLSGLNKRVRPNPLGSDVSQQQHIASQMDGLTGQASHWKNANLQQQSVARGFQFANAGMQKNPQMFEGGFSQDTGMVPFTVGQQQSVRYNLKQEPLEAERLDKSQQFAMSNFPQAPWNSIGQTLENNSRKEEQFQKRKSAQSPRVSAGGLPQSPLSSKSGEFSSGSIGGQFGAVTTSTVLGPTQKEKSIVTSVPGAGGTASLTSSGNDSMNRQHQAQASAKRRSNSVPRTPAMSGVGSPASVSNMGVSFSASSPGGTPALGDQNLLERFSKIEMLTMRFQLNCKKNKVDQMKNSTAYPSEQLLHQLSSDSSGENFNDVRSEMPLSTSVVGGSMNTCKIRVLNFERVQGNGFSFAKPRSRMIMSEKHDGSVAMYYGDVDEFDYFAVEETLPTLRNTRIADLLAAQFCSLMIREGYVLDGDHVQAKPINAGNSSTGQSSAPGISPNSVSLEMQQNSAAVSGQASSEGLNPSNSGGSMAPINGPLSIPSTRMLPPGNSPASQIPQAGLLPSGVSIPSSRPQPSEPQPSLQQQQQNQQALMQQQIQRSSALMRGSSPLAHLNGMGQNPSMQQLGNHMLSKPTALQLQMLQQHQQQQRKMIMGLGNVGMGNIGNNTMVGLQGIGNVMGMGGGRGVTGTGISAPLGMGNNNMGMGQTPMNMSISNALSQQLRSRQITPAQAAMMASRLRMGQSRTNMPGVPGQPNSSIGGLPGANRQMQAGSTGLSMLGPGPNRANINPVQRTAMGPPKMMPDMNVYMNPQQQQQQHLQLQQMQRHQLLQQQQQQQLQQDSASPLQAVVSPPQPVGSPSTMSGISMQQPQQQASPQQMSQRTPVSPQISSGAIHPPMTAGNVDANCPTSPLGSIGSVNNSSMDMQGVTKTS